MALTKITHSMIDGSIASVTDFGADPSGVSDSTAAIQLAINSGVDAVFFRAGSYKISGPITCVSNQRLYGSGTLVLYEGSSPFFFNVSSRTNVVFDGLSFAGRRSSWTYAFQAGMPDVSSRSRFSPIYGVGASQITIQNCSFSELYSAAIYLTGSIVSEKAAFNGFKVINCSCTSSNFELAVIIACGDILVTGCRTSENRNTSGLAQLVGNGFIATACNDVRITDNYFGACNGNGCKIESANGAIIFSNNTCELNDFNGVAFQESGIERDDVANHNERITVSGNTFIRPLVAGVGAESGTANAVWNATVTGNVFFGCVANGVMLSGKNWVVDGNAFIGPSVNRSGVSTSPSGVFINQGNGNTIQNITISNNTFDKNTAGVVGGAEVQLGNNPSQNMIVRGLNIVGNTIKNSIFRGVGCQNNVNVSDVLISGNVFSKDTLDGTTSQDIYVFNADHAVRWTVCNNTVAQGISVHLTNAGSYAAVYGNKVTATESKDAANGYIVGVNGTLASVYDLGRRLVQRASAAPLSGTYEVGDIVWNTSPTAGGSVGWICTTSGTPGTWKTFGAISA